MKRSSPSIYSTPWHIHRQEPRRGAVPSCGVNGNAAEPIAGEDLPDCSDRRPGGVVVGAQVAQDDRLRKSPASDHTPRADLPRLLVGQVPHFGIHPRAVHAGARREHSRVVVRLDQDEVAVDEFLKEPVPARADRGRIRRENGRTFSSCRRIGTSWRAQQATADGWMWSPWRWETRTASMSSHVYPPSESAWTSPRCEGRPASTSRTVPACSTSMRFPELPLRRGRTANPLLT